ncbi:ARM repeat-containing protein [Sistotremastrum niveocremeum HHB9708]|uniref:ARM repeat-containing protein n=1 Tax=Sistotremastrum niveocremeum HHB9708 TaxID=1314777 RepID=A0A165AIQ3_9AGAM|nr:ARM repeat-containing protein [Sistotremastrum niveocremeum HHB9708]
MVNLEPLNSPTSSPDFQSPSPNDSPPFLAFYISPPTPLSQEVRYPTRKYTTTSPVQEPTSPPLPTSPLELSSPVDLPSSSSPPPDTTTDRWPTHEQLGNVAIAQHDADSLCLDDETLTPVEKIYLFSRSTNVFHRCYIAGHLPTFLDEVSSEEAVEFVMPLIPELAMDEEESVKEDLASSLYSVMLWFFTHCDVHDYHESPIPDSDTFHPIISVSAFTPVLATLLVSANPKICTPARYAAAELLSLLYSDGDHTHEGLPVPTASLGPLRKELVHHLLMGIASLDHVAEPLDTSSESESHDSLDKTPMPTPQAHQSTDADKFSESFATALDSTESETDSSASASSDADSESTPSLSPGSASSQSTTPPFEESPRDFEILGSSDLIDPVSGCKISKSEQLEDIVVAPELVPFSSSIFSVEPPSTQDEGILTNSFEDSWSSSMESNEPSSSGVEEVNEQASLGRMSSMSIIASVVANDLVKLPLEIQDIFVSQVTRVAEDTVPWVRKECSFAVGALAKVVPPKMVRLFLLPLFKAFVSDQDCEVRYSSIFGLPGILTRLSPGERQILALTVLRSLSSDPSSSVRGGILEILGETIHAFASDEEGPPEELIDMFLGEPLHRTTERRDSDSQSLKMPLAEDFFATIEESERENGFDFTNLDSELEKLDLDPSRALICAFNIPAIVLAMGESRWNGRLRDFYMSLWEVPSFRVRHTLTASLGEIAKIIGPENAKRDLLALWSERIGADEHEVRVTAVECLQTFLPALAPADRVALASSLVDLWSQRLHTWRERAALTELVAGFAIALGEEASHCVTLMNLALSDSVAAVREAAVKTVPTLFVALAEFPVLETRLHDDIRSLAYDTTSYRRRVTYVACCQKLMDGQARIVTSEAECFGKTILQLSFDPTTEVRIAVSRLVRSSCDYLALQHRSRDPLLQETVEVLKQDLEPQVRAFVSSLPSEIASHADNVVIEVPAVMTPAIDTNSSPISLEAQVPFPISSDLITSSPTDSNQESSPSDISQYSEMISEVSNIAPPNLEADHLVAAQTEMESLDEVPTHAELHEYQLYLEAGYGNASSAADADLFKGETASADTAILQTLSVQLDAMQMQTDMHVGGQDEAETRQDEATPLHAVSEDSESTPTSVRDFTTGESGLGMPISDRAETDA